MPNVVTLLPTPRTSDTNGAGEHGEGGPDLRTVVSLLPTPLSSATSGAANFRPDGTPYSEGYGPTLLDAVRLLPTPRASDGEKGGPNQRGSKGDLTLSSAAHRIGAHTPRPSRGGKRSPAVVPPGQLTIEDA
ncbi:hypothetical protein [Streptomyces sp. VN1]|uniref:hypothetical protein n=1 Tax=Streptomyces sp. VN1 TaxID=1821625 RepID=UPI001E4BEC9A|nr:hypothetical protein [Streptomyces sp. VN1]